MTGNDSCHETVPSAVRTEMLEEYRHQCQGCGRYGVEAGGMVTLHVHHLTRNPDEMDEHDSENLTVLCRACHSWQHQQTTKDDVPVEFTEEDMTVLLSQDIEIVQILAESGPATTGEITAALSPEFTVTAVRERLWVLMGLDTVVPSRDQQIVDQDADTGKWGLVEQIEHSSRGRIPSDPHVLFQRIEDEFARQALDRGCDRDTLMTVLDISRRTTFYKEKRARAYEFPLDALRNRSGGRPPAGTDVDEQRNGPSAGGNAVEPSDTQQRLDAVNEGEQNQTAADGGNGGSTDEVATEESGTSETHTSQSPTGGETDPEACVREAIAALQALDEAL